MISRRGIGAALASIAVAGAIAVPAFALASGGGGSSTLTSPTLVQQTEGETDGATRDVEAACGLGRHGDRGAALAEALGVDLDTFQAAAQAARDSLGDRPDEITPEVMEARRAAFISALASELGISEADITSAIETLKAERVAALSDRLAQAVADGRITQERADELLQSIESGERPLGRFGPHHHFHGGFGPGGETTPTVSGASA